MDRTPRCTKAAALLAALALSVGCRRGGADPEVPAEGAQSARADAAGLPAFDVEGGAAPKSARPDVPHERYFVEVGDAPVRGAEVAPVTIVAFYDFECRFCLRGHQVMQQIEREYEGKVRIAYKAFPLEFHGQALIAALAVRSAQAQGKFWAFHDYLFSQPKIDMSRVDDYARAVGMDLKVMEDDIDTLRYGAGVRRDMRQGLRLGVRGTPAYFINGRPIGGARPVEEIRAMVDEELALAARWKAKGVADKDLYAYAIEGGYKSVEFTGRKGLRVDALYPVPIGASPVRGDPNAPVTVIAFTDFECPYCARGNVAVEKVRERYGDKVRFVFKHLPLPFHGHAFLAARAAMAAREQGKFWEYHDRLFALEAEIDEDDLLAIAKELRLDVKKIKAAIGSTTYDSVIAGDMELARTLGVRGTPAYFVNGRAINGAASELEFRLIVQEELERAEAKLAAGVSPSALYDVVTSEE